MKKMSQDPHLQQCEGTDGAPRRSPTSIRTVASRTLTGLRRVRPTLRSLKAWRESHSLCTSDRHYMHDDSDHTIRFQRAKLKANLAPRRMAVTEHRKR
jgi:hypothetical protein